MIVAEARNPKPENSLYIRSATSAAASEYGPR